MSLRPVDPADASAIIKAATEPTQFQRYENMLRIWIKAQEGLEKAATDGQKRTAWIIACGAAEATRVLLDGDDTPGAAA